MMVLLYQSDPFGGVFWSPDLWLQSPGPEICNALDILARSKVEDVTGLTV